MVRLRKPQVSDVPDLTTIINRDQTILPRSQHYIFENLRDFIVAEEGQTIIGCASLHVLWKDIAEVRAITVAEHRQHNGVFQALVRQLMEDGHELGIRQIVALTQNPEPLVDSGFRLVERSEVPPIVWKECINCVHFPDCRERPVLLDLSDTREGEQS